MGDPAVERPPATIRDAPGVQARVESLPPAVERAEVAADSAASPARRPRFSRSDARPHPDCDPFAHARRVKFPPAEAGTPYPYPH